MPTFARSNSAKYKAKQHGLTLFELLITLSILSLGALIAASVINRVLPQRTLDYAAEQLVSDLKRARLETQKTGIPVAVQITDKGYTASKIFDRRLKNEITINLKAESNEVIFQKGFANLGGVIILTKGKRRAIIAVQPITGKIERLE